MRYLILIKTVTYSHEFDHTMIIVRHLLMPISFENVVNDENILIN